jgi:hypothetical protein
MWQMSWLALRNYISANCRAFIVAATFGVTGGALVPLWLLSKDAIRNILVSQSPVVYFSGSGSVRTIGKTFYIDLPEQA